MSYYYSYGPSLSDQGISPDDIEYAWRCDCGAVEHTPGDLPKGWEMIQTGPDGCEYAYICGRCAARL
jgi:hypothetical protein